MRKYRGNNHSHSRWLHSWTFKADLWRVWSLRMEGRRVGWVGWGEGWDIHVSPQLSISDVVGQLYWCPPLPPLHTIVLESGRGLVYLGLFCSWSFQLIRCSSILQCLPTVYITENNNQSRSTWDIFNKPSPNFKEYLEQSACRLSQLHTD